MAKGKIAADMIALLDKVHPANVQLINWKGAKFMKDIISHHYFEIEAEIIFEVCQNKRKPLCDAVEKILDNL